jgi:hypothetical protein
VATANGELEDLVYIPSKVCEKLNVCVVFWFCDGVTTGGTVTVFRIARVVCSPGLMKENWGEEVGRPAPAVVEARLWAWLLAT